MTQMRQRRRVVVVDNQPLARAIGARIRDARTQRGLSQRKLAGDRYTGAYISALESGIAKPSMAALTYIAERLEMPVEQFLADRDAGWTRLRADLHLAAGDWEQADDAYSLLLERTSDARTRAELMRGLAEARCRLARGREAIVAAAEAAELFDRLGREADAAYARYWLANGEFLEDNLANARSLLGDILQRLRAGLSVVPDFKVRVLGALSNIESWEGNHDRALAYLAEALAAAPELDHRRRATLLLSLAKSYRETGDLEAAVRAGTESLALFRAADAIGEVAQLENAQALTYLRLGNTARAKDLVDQARVHANAAKDARLEAHIAETAAQISLTVGDRAAATASIERALELAAETGDYQVRATALLTRARLDAMTGDQEAVERDYTEAIALLREHGPRARLRQALAQWATSVAERGEHARANALYQEALS